MLAEPDIYNSVLANRLVGNPDGAAALEITIQGPEFNILEDCLISITGGDLSPSLGTKLLPAWECLSVEKGQVLSFGKRNRGARAYLSIAGGFKADQALGSQSTDLQAKIGGHRGRSLRKGDLLFRDRSSSGNQVFIKRKLLPEAQWEYGNPFVLRVMLGPQTSCFLPGTVEEFRRQEYVVTPNSNRMGYRLKGPRLEASPSEIISDPVPLGAVQVLPNGQLVLLMAEHQTVGGYPKIAVLISADVPRAAQLCIGDRVRFEAVSLERAQQLLRAQEEKILRCVIEA
ncbi:MAG: KipI antagonist [Acidobacteria bacterium]|nr:MAG: KipI antagonist [Acidobacteriota bacterium]